MSRPPHPPFLRFVPFCLVLALFPLLPACQQIALKNPGFSFKRKVKATGTSPGGQTAASASKRTPGETAFLEKCATLGAIGGTITGKDGYAFSAAELQRLSQITDPDAASLRGASAAITDFRDTLKRKGIELIFVPIPAKAVIFPDKISKDLKVRAWGKKPARLDSTLQTFYASLRSKDIKVIDPTDALLAARENRKAGSIFPKSAAVWSPRGAEVTATLIASEIKGGKWTKEPGKEGALITEPTTISYTGPMNGAAAPESLSARNIGRAADGKMRSVTFSTGGHPLTLIGDSSLLAWREANNPVGSSGVFASLADQLAYELQTIPDVFSGSADGRNAGRLRLLRETSSGRNPLSATKALVWVVPATDLALIDWKSVPLGATSKARPGSSASPGIPMFQDPPVSLIPDMARPAPGEATAPPAPIAPPPLPAEEAPPVKPTPAAGEPPLPR